MCGALQYVGDPNGRRGGVGDHQHQEGAANAEAGDVKNKRTRKKDLGETRNNSDVY